MKPSKPKPISTLTSKWTKTKILLKSKNLSSYIPETRLFNYSTLLMMLKKFKMVYVKPVHGSFGQGVMRVEWKKVNGKNEYFYQLGTKQRTFSTYDELFVSINKYRLKKKYLVQQGIHLLTHKTRPFDVRVMVQRTPQLPWKTTGTIGRVAHPNKVVTNYHSQGKPLALEVLLKSYLDEPAMQEYSGKLKELGVKIAKHLQDTYPGFREIGVDVGIAPNLHPWILEVNTAPDPFIFNQLKEKTMFRRVLRYARANGRFTRNLKRG